MTDEPYSITAHSTAIRSMRRLSEAVAAACFEFVAGPLANNAHRLGKPLRGDLTGLYSARRGDYRVIYRIDETARSVEIVRVDHRSAVYRA